MTGEARDLDDIVMRGNSLGSEDAFEGIDFTRSPAESTCGGLVRKRKL